MAVLYYVAAGQFSTYRDQLPAWAGLVFVHTTCEHFEGFIEAREKIVMSIEVLKEHLMVFAFAVTGIALVGITLMFPSELLGGALAWRVCQCAGWAFLTGVFLDVAVRMVGHLRGRHE